MKRQKRCQATKQGPYYVCDRTGFEWNSQAQHDRECPARHPDPNEAVAE
jgi:hypothetical protein